MKILVLSDSHGEMRYMEQAVFAETPDYIVHLGDKQRDGEALQKKFCRIPYIGVPGNCDFAGTEESVLVCELGGIRFLITHGHVHAVKYGLLRLGLAAAEAGASVALYGHTHRAAHDMFEAVHLFNPGAAGGGEPSYGVVEIIDGSLVCRIVKF